MENKTMIEQLLANRWFRFWKTDWSQDIVVYWPESISLDNFRADVRIALGCKKFLYELCLSIGDSVCCVAMENGLMVLENKSLI